MKKSLLSATLAALALLLPAAANAADGGQKQVAQLWYDAFTRHDGALLERILADTWTDIPSPPRVPEGPRGAQQTLAWLTESFPDFAIAVEDMVQEGDKVVVRARMTGTQSGPFLGRPATGRRVDIQAVDIHEIRNGRIIRTWHTEDWMTGLRQLGMLVEPAATPPSEPSGQ